MSQQIGERSAYGHYDEEDVEDKSAEHKKQLEDLFLDISSQPEIFDASKNDKEFREHYRKIIVPLISNWAQRTQYTPNFVHEVLGCESSLNNRETNDEVLFAQRFRVFLLEIAIPENLDQLADKPAESKGRTAMHRAIESPKQLSFALLFCKLMEEAIEAGKLTKTKAAYITSQTNMNNENCLHQALFKDLDVSERLIELADDATFMQQRANGNTPLHDALEFPIPAERKSRTEHRYLVPAPICETPALKTPMDEFAQKAKSDSAPQRSSCCNRCQDADRKYRKLKMQRSRIICALVRKCPAPLAIHNNIGKSPFSYHVMAREEFRKKNPDFNIAMNQRKSPYKQLVLLEGPTRTSRVPPLNTSGLQVGGNQGVIVSPRGDAKTLNSGQLSAPTQEEQIANVGFPRTVKGNSSFGPGGIARTPTLPNMEDTKQYEDCSPDSPRDWFYFSGEVEKLLWETAFHVGGYEKARRCLFPSAAVRQDKNLEGNLVPSEDEEFHDVFIPTGRVTIDTKGRYPHFKFLSTLAYVHLKVTPTPETDQYPKTPQAQTEWKKRSSKALEVLFQWLTGSKKVERILMLVVEDNEMFPCSEMAIRNCLAKLKDVRYLDWRRPNLSIQTLEEAGARNIVELWLYSTGINAVLSSWADQGGLQTLEKLREVHLEAKPGIETDEANNTNVESFKKKLKTWYAGTPRVLPKVNVDSKSATSLGSHNAQGANNSNAKRSNPWLGKMQKLTIQLNRLSPEDSKDDESETVEDKNAMQYVKVALLDDGVDPEVDGLGKFMSGRGWPKPSEAAGGRTQPESFYTAGPMKHGNQMAKLITMACPFVRLYVAKINAGGSSETIHHPTFDVTRAIEAIRWAIRENVEVISMSWNVMLDDNHPHKQALEDVIREASRRKILLYCAASEKKPSTGGNKAWPSSCGETFSIGAASDHRTAKDYVGNDARFLFPSDDDGHDGGSSAATAVAAGLASLILYCLKSNRQEEEQSNMEKEKQTGQKEKQTGQKEGAMGQKEKQIQQPPSAAGDDPRGMMEKVFDSLCQKGSSYVDIDTLLGKGTVSYGSITKHCQPHIKTGGNAPLKPGRKGDGRGWS